MPSPQALSQAPCGFQPPGTPSHVQLLPITDDRQPAPFLDPERSSSSMQRSQNKRPKQDPHPHHTPVKQDATGLTSSAQATLRASAEAHLRAVYHAQASAVPAQHIGPPAFQVNLHMPCAHFRKWILSRAAKLLQVLLLITFRLRLDKAVHACRAPDDGCCICRTRTSNSRWPSRMRSLLLRCCTPPWR